jgi:hypothetical protein
MQPASRDTINTEHPVNPPMLIARELTT